MNVRSAVFYSSISQAVIQIIGLASVVILSRLLAPDELGVYAIAASMVFIATELRNLGTANHIIREETVTPALQKTCLGVTILISWSLGSLIFLFSPLISDFYEIPDLEDLFQILTISFFISPFTVIPHALLTRSMQFHKLLVIGISVRAFTVTVSIGFVLNGASYYGITYGQVAGALLGLFLNLLFAPKNTQWIPSFSGSKHIFISGFSFSIANLLNRFSIMSSDLVIGKLGSPHDVAVFSRGIGFLDFLANVVTMGGRPVVLPYLSNVQREKGDINYSYNRAASLIVTIIWPVLGVAAMTSEEIIIFFFGNQWSESSTLVAGLSVWMFFRVAHVFSPAVFTTRKREGLRLFKEATILFATVLTIALTYKSGLETVSRFMALVGLLEFIITTTLMKIYFRLEVLEYIKNTSKALLITVLCMGSAYLYRQLAQEYFESAYSYVIILAITISLIWLLLIWLFRTELFMEGRNFLRCAINR